MVGGQSYIQLMYGPSGNSQFCFPESPDVSRDEVEFPEGPYSKCFVIYLDFPLNNHTLFYSVRGQQLR